jgi:hypothetical protein
VNVLRPGPAGAGIWEFFPQPIDMLAYLPPNLVGKFDGDEETPGHLTIWV